MTLASPMSKSPPPTSVTPVIRGSESGTEKSIDVPFRRLTDGINLTQTHRALSPVRHAPPPPCLCGPVTAVSITGAAVVVAAPILGPTLQIDTGRRNPSQLERRSFPHSSQLSCALTVRLARTVHYTISYRQPIFPVHSYYVGAPGRIRTYDTRFRNAVEWVSASLLESHLTCSASVFSSSGIVEHHAVARSRWTSGWTTLVIRHR